MEEQESEPSIEEQDEQPQSEPPMAKAEFSTGLCDCFSDIGLCWLTLWCPCITFGRIAEIVDKGTPPCVVSGMIYLVLLGFTGSPWLNTCVYRSRLKAMFGFDEYKCCEDCCIHFCCVWCALCQEYRELQHRGYNVALGWQGNMVRNPNQEMMPPSMPGGMTR